MAATSAECPASDCRGTLARSDRSAEYECQRCGRRLRASVVERIDSFRRIADSDLPAAELAQAALEGQSEE